MRPQRQAIYSRLSPCEKNIMQEFSTGLNVYFKALTFEPDLIRRFIEELPTEKKRPRRPYRFYFFGDIKQPIFQLRSYLQGRFSYTPTDQEIYWLTAKYLLTKFPGFRNHSPN